MFILYYGAPICLKFVSASMISTMRRQEKNCYSQHEANKAGPTTKHKTSLLNSAFLTFTMRMNWQMTCHFMKISSCTLQHIPKLSITYNQQFYSICSARSQHMPSMFSACAQNNFRYIYNLFVCLNGPKILDPVVGRPQIPGFSLKPKGLACL